MKNILRSSALVAVLLLLTGCSAMSDTFTQTVAGMVGNGSLTPEQGTAVIQAFTAAAESQNWWEIPLNILGGALLAFMGVRIQRGAPTQRVGLPTTKVHTPSPA